MRTCALERDIERLQSRLTSVEEDYADAEKSLEAVRADLRAAEGRVEELEAKLLAAEEAREEAERERDEARRCLNAIPNGHLGCAKDHSARLAEWLECWICKEEAAESRAAGLAEALAPFADPERYNTAEEECRENKAMRWCAVHSFRWPCPVGPARAAIAAEEGK